MLFEDVVGFFLDISPFFTFVFMVILTAVLSLIDEDVQESEEVEFHPAFSWVMFGVLTCFSYFVRGGRSFEEAFRFVSYLYLAAIVGSFFRPALMMQSPVFDNQSLRPNYKVVYFITGWITLIATLFLH